MQEEVYQINMAVRYFRSFLTSLFVTCSFVSTSYFFIGFVICFRACYMEVGGPQVGEVTRLGGVTRLSI